MIIDNKVVNAFIHHANHMEHERYIPKEILNIEFDMLGGIGKISVKQYFDDYRKRVVHLADYFIDAKDAKEDSQSQLASAQEEIEELVKARPVQVSFSDESGKVLFKQMKEELASAQEKIERLAYRERDLMERYDALEAQIAGYKKFCIQYPPLDLYAVEGNQSVEIPVKSLPEIIKHIQKLEAIAERVRDEEGIVEHLDLLYHNDKLSPKFNYSDLQNIAQALSKWLMEDNQLPQSGRGE